MSRFRHGGGEMLCFIFCTFAILQGKNIKFCHYWYGIHAIYGNSGSHVSPSVLFCAFHLGVNEHEDNISLCVILTS